jgi:hypothetical protein
MIDGLRLFDGPQAGNQPGITDRSQVVKIGEQNMSETKIERMARLLGRLAEMGLDFSEAKALLRIERTLQRWGEAECGNSNNFASWGIERDETSGKPFMVTYPHAGQPSRRPIADRESAAKARLEKIMARHPKLVAYHQGDCRGCNLYILRKSDLREGESLDSVYTRGVAVCA